MTGPHPHRQAGEMDVAFAIADKAPARPFDGPRAAAQCNSFWFLRSAGSRDLIPLPGATAAQLDRFRAAAGATTAVAADSDEIGQLAAAAARRLKEEAAPALVAQIDVIIVCSTGIDSPVGVSIAGKVKHIIGAPEAFAFAIGQLDGCAAFEALRIAHAFLHGPEQARVVAVVASECWWYPYLRSFGDYAQYGDGAAAILLRAAGPDAPGEAAGGERIVDVALDRYQAQLGPFDLQAPRWFDAPAWPQAVGDFLAALLRRHGLRAADLLGIDSPCLAPAFIDAVGRAAGLPLAPADGGFVSAVEPLLALTAGAGGAGGDGYFLSWSVGLNGEMGACLRRRAGAAPAPSGERH